MDINDGKYILHITVNDDVWDKEDAPQTEAATSEECVKEKENGGPNSDSSIAQRIDISQENFVGDPFKSGGMVHAMLLMCSANQAYLKKMKIHFYNPFSVNFNEHVDYQVMVSEGIGTLSVLLETAIFHPYFDGKERSDVLALIYHDVLFYEYGREKGINEYEFD